MNPALVVFLFAQIIMRTPATDIALYAEVKKGISSNRSHVGDPVTLVVLEDWRDGDGHLLIPAKARLTGKVVSATRHRGQQPGTLSFVVEHGDWRGGSMPMHATLQSLVVMGARSGTADMPLRRGVDGQDMSVNGHTVYLLDEVPKDCSVELLNQSEADTAAVCRRRDVRFKEGAQVLLVNHVNTSRTRTRGE